MNVEIETNETHEQSGRPWNSADVSGLSAREVEEYVQTATENDTVYFERKGGRTFVVIDE